MSEDKEKNKLSVIVPVYNAEKYLNRCIRSILNQTYKNIELVLVDDGSTDKSVQICDKWTEEDSRVYAYHIKNGGPSNARNYGLKSATGRFIAFVDADDFLNPNMYEKMIESLIGTNCGMAVCKWTIHNIDTGTKEIANIGTPGIVDAIALKKIIAADDNAGGGGYPWNKVIDQTKVNVSLKIDIQFRDGLKIYEDKIWLLEVLDHINEAVLIDTIGYNYEIKQNSLSHGNFSKKIVDFVAAWDIIENECFHGITTKEIDNYRAVGIIDWFWKAKKENECHTLRELWRRQRLHVKKVIGRLAIRDIIKYMMLDCAFRLYGIHNGEELHK